MLDEIYDIENSFTKEMADFIFPSKISDLHLADIFL